LTAVHAGLECGVLKKKLPDVDMISFGQIYMTFIRKKSILASHRWKEFGDF